MKIAYITNTCFLSKRAHATQIAHMCQAFQKTGNEVVLVTNNRQTNVTLSPDVFFGFIPSFKTIQVRFGVLFVPYSKFFFVFNNFFFCLFALQKINITDFDIVYIRDEWLGFFLSFVVSKNKLVYESHEAKYNFPARFLLKKGIKCICISEGIYNSYKEKGVDPKQMIVAHDGIDQSFFGAVTSKKEARERLGLPQAKKIAMYIGGFDEWKGVDTFFGARKFLKEVTFVAIGGNDEQIEKYKKKYPHVIFLGSLPYRDLKDNQQAADILVIPNTGKSNLSARYTSPLKLFAHMTSKVPILMSAIPSLQVVLSDDYAYTFKSDDSSDLARKLRIVLSQKDIAYAKANKTYGLSKKYTWDNRAKSILNFILNFPANNHNT